MALYGYALIHANLLDRYGPRGISEKKLRRSIETMPGISFPSGTRLEDVREGLIKTGLLSKVSRKGQVSYYLNY